MKPIPKILLLTACLTALAAFAQSPPPQSSPQPSASPSPQSPPQASPSPQGGADAVAPRPALPEADVQAQTLQEKLALDDGQKAKIKANLEDQHAQRLAVMKDESLSPEDRTIKMRSIHADALAKIRDALNDDQKKKFDAMVEENQERARPVPPKTAGESAPK
jgi:hypothetical protein